MKIPHQKFVPNFIDIFPSLNSEAKVKLKLALDELESIPHSFCGGAWLNSYHFLFTSESVVNMLGYERELFFENAMMFIHSITLSQYINHIHQAGSEYILKIEESGIGLKYPLAHTVEAPLRKQDGSIVHIRHHCVFPDCNSSDLSNSPFLAIGIWLDIDKQSLQEVEVCSQKAKEILLRIKEAYWELYPDRFEIAQSYFVKHVTPQILLTPKEKQILILLSSGHTTKEISSRLSISFHTVESHRKHLIRKFDVRNSVELLAKVNAIYNIEAGI